MNISDPCSPHNVSGWESGTFQADDTTLSEMLPACDDVTLSKHLRMLWDDPNLKSTINNLLLDQDTPGLDQEISIVPEHTTSFQKRCAVKQQTKRGRDTLQIGAASDKRVVSIDIDKRKSSSVCSSAEVMENLQCGNKGLETDDEVVFIKSVSSPVIQPCRKMRCPESGLSSESEESSICLCQKDGAPRRSKKKARKSPIVIIDDDINDGISYQSPKKKTNSSCHPVARESSSVCDRSASSITAISDEGGNEFSDVVVSGSKKNATGINEPVTIPGNQVSTSSCVPWANSSFLYDLEILKKVFPCADPDNVCFLLDKYADRLDRVALVGKELGSIPNPREMVKVPMLFVPWFWQLEGASISPFSVVESMALEKEYSTRYSMCFGDTSGNIKLPGSDERYYVDFATMTMTCGKGQKTKIFRGLSCDEGSMGPSGRKLVPEDSLAVPASWEEQTRDVELISVCPGSAEWNHVEGSVKRSLREAQVTDIQRIQNKWLYRKYAVQRHLIKEKNGPTCVNEKELFHATRSTSPSLIWQGEDGFDMRHSSDGMWGRGTYFASEASYSHLGYFHYNTERKTFQLFLAHVLTGDSISLPPNRNIKMPPLKRWSTIRYDSVNGVTQGCLVYILYKLDMAYPTYLINYTIGLS